jgi:hypothetical protein
MSQVELQDYCCFLGRLLLLFRQFYLHRETPEADTAVVNGLPVGRHRHSGRSQDHQQEQSVYG